MVDHHQSTLLSTGATTGPHNKKKKFQISDLCNEYISIIGRICGFNRTHFSKSPSRSSSPTPTRLSDLINDVHVDKGNRTRMNEVHSLRLDTMKGNRGGSYRFRNSDYFVPIVHSPSSKLPSPSPSPRSSFVGSTKIDGFPHTFSRNMSRSSTPIMFSSSMKVMKPPTEQINLDCMLEELCFGCTKQMRVTRDVCTRTGMIMQEEEILTINVKPGWKKGTKVTFEGMGREKDGFCAADVMFVVQEKKHSLFRREGDDLEIGIEIPLVKALTGCQLSVPLLGGENKILDIEDVIYHGYEVLISGQGMPISKENGKRGNLKVVFLVNFPHQLSHDQRLEVANILDL